RTHSSWANRESASHGGAHVRSTCSLGRTRCRDPPDCVPTPGRTRIRPYRGHAPRTRLTPPVRVPDLGPVRDRPTRGLGEPLAWEIDLVGQPGRHSPTRVRRPGQTRGGYGMVCLSDDETRELANLLESVGWLMVNVGGVIESDLARDVARRSLALAARFAEA